MQSYSIRAVVCETCVPLREASVWPNAYERRDAGLVARVAGAGEADRCAGWPRTETSVAGQPSPPLIAAIATCALRCLRFTPTFLASTVRWALAIRTVQFSGIAAVRGNATIMLALAALPNAKFSRI